MYGDKGTEDESPTIRSIGARHLRCHDRNVIIVCQDLYPLRGAHGWRLQVRVIMHVVLPDND